MADRPDGAPPRLRPLGVAAAILGLLLFVWALRQTGPSQILEGARQVGWGFLVILALSGLRFWVRAWAWAIATDANPPLRVRETFPALVAGDALGNLTPLGLFVSEPVKAAYVRPRVTLMDALTGITIENLLYTMSVAVVIAAGMVALLVLFNVGEAARDIAVGALVVIALAFVRPLPPSRIPLMPAWSWAFGSAPALPGTSLVCGFTADQLAITDRSMGIYGMPAGHFWVRPFSRHLLRLAGSRRPW